jgi:hypothetical protein
MSQDVIAEFGSVGLCRVPEPDIVGLVVDEGAVADEDVVVDRPQLLLQLLLVVGAHRFRSRLEWEADLEDVVRGAIEM